MSDNIPDEDDSCYTPEEWAEYSPPTDPADMNELAGQGAAGEEGK